MSYIDFNDLTPAQLDKARRHLTLRVLNNKWNAVLTSEKGLSAMTKAQISEFGASIGVTLSMSLTKEVMIQTLTATEEYALSEERRKKYDNLSYILNNDVPMVT